MKQHYNIKLNHLHTLAQLDWIYSAWPSLQVIAAIYIARRGVDSVSYTHLDVYKRQD